jgi:hypothetical protein
MTVKISPATAVSIAVIKIIFWLTITVAHAMEPGVTCQTLHFIEFICAPPPLEA